MAFFSGKGDKGETTTLSGSFSKDSSVVEALGALDEYNSFLGICRSGALRAPEGEYFEKALLEMQNDCFIIQAYVAGAEKRLSRERVNFLEKLCADCESRVPKINSFTVPGSSFLSARLDFARALARRAERRVVKIMKDESVGFDENVLAYLNRASSALFALARLDSHLSGKREKGPHYGEK